MNTIRLNNESGTVSAKSHLKSSGFYETLNFVPVLRGFVDEHKMCSLICDREPQAGAPIFISVHGTWARSATWTQIGSPLIKALQKEWPEAGFYRFKWSGGNGIKHRLIAAKELAAELDILSSSHPSSKIITLSHSHGGNVVAWASTSIRSSLSAAIYLNTPFIQALGPSDTSRPVLRAVLWFGGAIVMMLLGGALGLHKIDGDWGHAAFLSFALVPAYLLQKFVPIRIRKLSIALGAVSTDQRKISRELVVSAVGDEPASLLGGVYFGQWLIWRITGILFFLFLALLGISSVFPSLLPESKFENEIGPFIVGCIFGFLGLLLLIGAGSYGILQGLIALDSSVTVAPSPLGQVESINIGWDSESDQKLQHSIPHQSPQVGATIVKWLGPVIGSSPNS